MHYFHMKQVQKIPTETNRETSLVCPSSYTTHIPMVYYHQKQQTEMVYPFTKPIMLI